MDYKDDDGRVIADMSGVERQPMFIPDASAVRRLKEEKKNEPLSEPSDGTHGPEYIDKEGRRAMIGGALSAMLLVGGIIFAAFAAIILIIGHLG